MKTYHQKASEVQRDWLLIDADGQVLGRLATQIATLLRGKHKPTYTPSMDGGDFVIVTNVERIKIMGKKADQKVYYRHTGYPGGLKEIPAGKLLAKKPERLVEFAVKGMLPKGPLGRQMARKLKVYPGDRHPHEAQKPVALPIPDAARAR